LLKKRRKYPIKRDEFGDSARRRAFDEGLRPAQVIREVEISLRTACRYFADWKKHRPKLEARYYVFKKLLKSQGELSERTVRMLSEALHMSVEEAVWRLQRPWGLKQLLMGRWPNHVREARQSEAESRLLAALRIVRAIELWGLTPERQRRVVERVVKALFDEALHRGSYAGGI
jgi:hypothetical protein